MSITGPRTGLVNASDGIRLHYRLWPADAARAGLVVVHGLAEHGGRYDALGRELADHGIAVLVPDLRGHGRSEGTRGHTPSFAQLLEDVHAMRAALRETIGPAGPLCVLGHSMGGLITIRCIEAQPDAFDAAVIISPWLGTAQPVPSWKLALAEVLLRFAPALPIPAGIDANLLSRDPMVVRAYREDPLVHGRITPRLFNEARQAMARAGPDAGAVRCPVLMLVAGDDGIVDAGRARAFAEMLAPERTTVDVYEGHRHELLNEPDAADIRRKLRMWLEGQIAAGASRPR